MTILTEVRTSDARRNRTFAPLIVRGGARSGERAYAGDQLVAAVGAWPPLSLMDLSLVLYKIAERRVLTALNADTMKGSFPEVDDEVAADS